MSTDRRICRQRSLPRELPGARASVERVHPLAVVCGGPSLEHEISLKSGHEVIEQIDRDRYDPIPVVIRLDGSWEIASEPPRRAPDAASELLARGVDTCFIALHGPFGEDGRIQAFLETCGLRYTGSGPGACAVTGDKILAKRVVASLGIRCAPDLVSPPANASEIARVLGFPCVIKNPHQGSTLGMELAHDEAALGAALGRLGDGCDRLLIEECVQGREFTVSILDLPGAPARALPVTEILADGYFDFTKKYSDTKGAEEICPAQLDAATTERMVEWSLAAHRTFGMSALSRTDFLLPDDGTPVYLETNAIPGLTSRSLFPQACAVAGIPFHELITLLIEAARR